MLSVSSHLRDTFNHETRVGRVMNAVVNLQTKDFDVIVVTGISGTVPGAIIAHLMGKGLAVVRREGENTVGGGSRVEGHLGGKWIFLDDFIVSGGTQKRAIAEYTRACAGGYFGGKTEEEYVGTYLFNYDRFIPAGERCSGGDVPF